MPLLVPSSKCLLLFHDIILGFILFWGRNCFLSHNSVEWQKIILKKCNPVATCHNTELTRTQWAWKPMPLQCGWLTDLLSHLECQQLHKAVAHSLALCRLHTLPKREKWWQEVADVSAVCTWKREHVRVDIAQFKHILNNEKNKKKRGIALVIHVHTVGEHFHWPQILHCTSQNCAGLKKCLFLDILERWQLQDKDKNMAASREEANPLS